jgi:hypothetical protein
MRTLAVNGERPIVSQESSETLVFLKAKIESGLYPGQKNE